MMTLSQMADRFEKLLVRLPGSIRTPVEREWRPLRELFLNRRPPRLLLIGPGAEAFVRSVLLPPIDLLRDGEAPPHLEPVIEERGLPWRTVRHRGALQFAVAHGRGEAAKSAIAASAPDCFLLLAEEETPDLAVLRDLHHFDFQRYGQPAPIVATGDRAASLAEALHGDAALASHVAAVVPLSRREALLDAIARSLPEDSRLEFARVTGEKAVQREIANTLSRSATAICAAIGTQPIPLADFPILTSLQALMVAGIIHVSGREWSVATARDFVAALGVNVGAGLVLREGARAAVKLIPAWGNAISGAVAGAGTYALGRAATAYFIEGLPIDEARRRFRLGRRKKKKDPPALPPA